MGFQERRIFKVGSKESISVPASSKIAVKALGGSARVYKTGEYTNLPSVNTELAYVDNDEFVSDAFSEATEIEIVSESGGEVYYSVGTAPVVKDPAAQLSQTTPGTLNATGTLTAALLNTRLVTSTTASAVAATLDTGAIMEASGSYDLDDSFDFSVINTGGSNAFTVTASAGHTVVGEGIVAADSSGLFRTRKTAVDTFVTYRIG